MPPSCPSPEVKEMPSAGLRPQSPTQAAGPGRTLQVTGAGASTRQMWTGAGLSSCHNSGHRDWAGQPTWSPHPEDLAPQIETKACNGQEAAHQPARTHLHLSEPLSRAAPPMPPPPAQAGPSWGTVRSWASLTEPTLQGRLWESGSAMLGAVGAQSQGPRHSGQPC